MLLICVVRVVVLSLACSFFRPALIFAQSSTTPTTPRFEVGGSFISIRASNVSPEVGLGVDTDMNFGRYVALDAAFNWLPATSSQTVGGFFGVKAGVRRDRFGFFGKFRPGFLSSSDLFRSDTFNVDTLQDSNRRGRLTERAFDLGGVVEYYPHPHWLIRWDMGDTFISEESGQFTIIGGGNPPLTRVFPHGTTSHFQFSTGVHYRL